MILLDTNVVSELMKTTPEPDVADWVAGRPADSMFISAITEAELRYGVAILAHGKRRKVLETSINNILTNNFRDRILAFDSFAAVAFAEIAAERRRSGRRLSQPDLQIAATARAWGAGIATRNTADFEFCGIEIINPWTSRH